MPIPCPSCRATDRARLSAECVDSRCQGGWLTSAPCADCLVEYPAEQLTFVRDEYVYDTQRRIDERWICKVCRRERVLAATIEPPERMETIDLVEFVARKLGQERG